MKNTLAELKKLAHLGYETAILNAEPKSKEIFWEIIKLTELTSISPEEATNIPAKRSYDQYSEEQRDDIYLVAFCFSYFGHKVLFPNDNQTNALKKAAQLLDVKYTTLKNRRDLFDGHNNNSRKGWSNSPLPPQMQKVKIYLESLEKHIVINKAKKALNL